MKLMPDHTALRHCEDGSLEGEVEMWQIGNIQIRERKREIHCVTEARITSHRIIFSMDSSAIGCICLRDFMCAWCIGGNYIALVPIIRRVVDEVYLRISNRGVDDVYRVLTDVFKTRPWLKGSYEPDSIVVRSPSSVSSVPTTSDLSHLLSSFNHSSPPTPRPVGSLCQHMMHPHFRAQQQQSDGRASHCGTDGSGSCAAGSEVTQRDTGDVYRLGELLHGRTVTPSVSRSTLSDPAIPLPARGGFWRDRENPEQGGASEVTSEPGAPCFTLFSQHSLFDIDALCSSPGRSSARPADDHQDGEERQYLWTHRPHGPQLQGLELEHQQKLKQQKKQHQYKQKQKHKHKPHQPQQHREKQPLPHAEGQYEQLQPHERQLEQQSDQREERREEQHKPPHKPQLRPHQQPRLHHQPHIHHQPHVHRQAHIHHQLPHPHQLPRPHHQPHAQGQYLPYQEQQLAPFLVPQQHQHQMPVMDTLLNTLNACWNTSPNDLSSYLWAAKNNQADAPLPGGPLRHQQKSKALRHAVPTPNEEMNAYAQLPQDIALAHRAPHEYPACEAAAKTKDKITASAWSYRKKLRHQPKCVAAGNNRQQLGDCEDSAVGSEFVEHMLREPARGDPRRVVCVGGNRVD
eukprot:GEMP01016343.1.p1 GENE.GEMP01016343.1~~GEMP01016343.1.p1  ORF type:complete len:629 (+),score=146.42 GEMP01016343.1:61-1947(+)